MKKYIVFECDNWHSTNSMNLVAVCSNLKTAIRLIKKYAKEQGEKISSDDLYNLQNILQTQNFEGEGEFNIKVVEQNILL